MQQCEMSQSTMSYLTDAKLHLPTEESPSLLLQPEKDELLLYIQKNQTEKFLEKSKLLDENDHEPLTYF